MWRTLFYRLPRLTALTIILLLAAGAAALLSLGRQEDPTLVERYGRIVTLYPGADAERVEALVSRPLETALLELPEVQEVTSVSRANVSAIRIDVREDLSVSEVDEAWTLIRQKAEQARAAFPEGVGAPDVERSYLGASTLIVALVWTGGGEPELAVMNRMAQELEDRFQNLPGTEETDVYGEPQEEIRIAFDPDALAAAGLDMRRAAGLIARSDAKAPAGQMRAPEARLNMEVGGEFDSIARVRAVPLVQRPDGSALRVGDLATVSKGLADPAQQMALINGRRAILVAAFIEPESRVDVWAASARRLVEEYAAGTGGTVDVEIVFDQSVYTADRLHGLASSLGYSALIVLGVLMVFMGWRSAIVVGSALPLTVALVLALFGLTGIPLHQMSVTGLIIALGLLIDNAIVVADEYEQQRQKGVDRFEAIDASLKHLFGPLFASTLTTALAFAPIALMPGTAGEFIGTMGLSVIFAVTGSFFVAIFIVPALAAWMDRPRTQRAKDHGHRWWRNGYSSDTLTEGYRWTLDAVLRAPLAGLAMGFGVAVLGGYLASGLPMQFFPQTERDQFQIEMILPAEASIAQTEAAAQEATRLLLAHEGIERVNWTIGEGAPRVYYNVFNQQTDNPGYAAGWVQARDADAVRDIVASVQAEMRRAFPQAQFLALPFEQGPPIDAPILFDIVGPNLEELNRLGEAARVVLAQTPGVTFTRASLKMGAPTLVVKADEAQTQLAGDRLADLAADMAAQLEGVPAGSVLEGVEDIPVRVIAPQSRRSDLTDLRGMLIGARPGALGTPLAALGQTVLEPRTAQIMRRNGERVNTIYAWLEPFTLPAPAFADFLQRLDASGVSLPPGYRLSTGGEAAERGEATAGLMATALPLFIIMAGAVTLVFNSFRIAFIILLTGGLSIATGFIGVWLFGLPMGFNAIVGGLGLFGISINGAIVVLSALRASPEAMANAPGAPREVIVACTRHIVATTLTTVGGFIPIIVAGDMFWLPLATSIAVGVGASAVLALYFAPALFFLPGFGQRRQALAAAAAAAATAP